MAKLEEQLARLMQSAPADVSVTPKGAAPLSPPPPVHHSSPSLAKSGRRRSAFELVRIDPFQDYFRGFKKDQCFCMQGSHLCCVAKRFEQCAEP